MVYHYGSPIIAMPPLASTPPTPSSLHRHASHDASATHLQPDGSSSSSTSLAPSTQTSHQIPFQATPVHHGPTPLSFGFGFGSSGSSTPQSSALHQQWGQPSTATPTSHFSPSSARFASPSYQSVPSTSRRSEAKRRRDDDDGDSDSEMDTAGPSREKSGSPLSNRPMASSRQTLPKRMRAGLGAVGLMSLDEGATRQNPSLPASSTTSSKSAPSESGTGRLTSMADRVDVGRILATLDKPSLLSLFHKLLQSSSDPGLRDQIVSLLPSPSLDSIEPALDEAEKAIRAALPSAGQHEVRAEFAWGRLRSPVAEFVHTAQGFLPLFVDEDLPSAPSSTGEGSSKRERPHVSTTFNFLHLVTVRALRILETLPAVPRTASMFALDRQQPGPMFRIGNCEAVKQLSQMLPTHAMAISSPNSIVNQLLPQLALQWTRLFERVAKAVNEEGKMFGAEMVRGWIGSLNALVAPQQGDAEASVDDPVKAMRSTLNALKSRLEHEVGWLVGVHRGSSSSSFSYSTAQHYQHQPPTQQHLHSRPMDPEEEL